ncbi:unnamed protein product, partial [marine sediment metagenome]
MVFIEQALILGQILDKQRLGGPVAILCRGEAE